MRKMAAKEEDDGLDTEIGVLWHEDLEAYSEKLKKAKAAAAAAAAPPPPPPPPKAPAAAATPPPPPAK